MFVYHRLGKLDTLAGLAIRYGVTVSDLKRANGLHSEMGMFALRELKVPKGQLPASHAGFQALLSQRRTPPEISTEASSALDKLRSHYGTGRLLPEAGGEAVAGGEGGGGAGAGGAASAGGSATTSGRGAGEADVGTAGGSRLGSEEVAAVVLREAAEQLERQKLVSVKDISAEKGGDPGGPLSLKKRGSNGELAVGGGAGLSPEMQRLKERMGGISDSIPAGQARRPLFTEGHGPGRVVRNGKDGPPLRSGSSRSFFQKLKQVAQQPALAGPPGSSIPLLEIGGAAAGRGADGTPSSGRSTPKSAELAKSNGSSARSQAPRSGGPAGKAPPKGRKAD